MPDKSIMVLPDIHSDPAARQKTSEMLKDGQIKVLYLEWSKPIDPGDLDRSFAGLAPGDARPTLKELAQIAIDRNIPVVPVDMPPAEVLRTLDTQSPAYAPHSEHSLYQPWGEAVRDKYTAEKIAEDIRARPDGTIALLMYGADHFKKKMDGDTELAGPLNKLIIEHREADVYMLKPQFGQIQPSAAPAAQEQSAAVEKVSQAQKM
jgi:hypothetical protein